MSDELKSAMIVLRRLDFPSGVLAVLGGFSFGVGIFYGEISLTNRKLMFGIFLMLVAGAWHYLSGLVRLTLISFNSGKKRVSIQWSWIIPAGIFLFLSYISGISLWNLMHTP